MLKYVLLCIVIIWSKPTYASADDLLISIIKTNNKENIGELFSDQKQHNEHQNIPLMQKFFHTPERFCSKELEPYLKIQAADVLMQAYRNKQPIDPKLVEEISKYALVRLNSADTEEVQLAINIVGLSDSTEGYNALYQIIKAQEPSTFEAAVLSLVMMCKSFNSSEFQNLMSELNTDNIKRANEINNTIGESIRMSGWCYRD